MLPPAGQPPLRRSRRAQGRVSSMLFLHNTETSTAATSFAAKDLVAVQLSEIATRQLGIERLARPICTHVEI